MSNRQMHYVGRRRSETNPLASSPLLRPAAQVLRPSAPWPAASTPSAAPTQLLFPSEQDQRNRDLANAEAALAEMVRVFEAARAGIGEANRTSMAPILLDGRVIMPARRLTAERVRERRSYAFRLFNKRRGQVAAARRRVDAARAALGLPTLATIEQRAAVKAELRASKKQSVHAIAAASNEG